MTAAEVAPVGLRQPCPCGSGRRYKACHGRADGRRGTRVERVTRPFAGVAAETDWIALRELVPAGTAPARLSAKHAATKEHKDRELRIVSALPGGWPALVREDGTILLALQVPSPTGDPGRDVAGGLLSALATEPGGPAPDVVETDLRIADLLDASVPAEVTVHDGFDFWTEGMEADPILTGARERADAALVPTVRLTSVEAAYWCEIGTRRHLRWVQPHDEGPLLDALARLHVADADRLGEGTRLLGSFRSCGLLVPVWDLPVDAPAEAMEEPAQEFQERLAETLTVDKPLSSAERGARAGLANRQLTLR